MRLRLFRGKEDLEPGGGDENNVDIKSRPSSPHAKPSAIRSAGAAKSQLVRPEDDRRTPEETHTRWKSAKVHGALRAGKLT